MTINDELLQLLRNNKLTLEEFFILYSKHTPTRWLLSYKPLEISYNKLIAEGYLTKGRTISANGSKFMNEKFLGLAEDNAEIMEAYKKFLDAYPDSDEYAHFEMTRNFKNEKAKAKPHFKLAMSKYGLPLLLAAVDKYTKARMASSTLTSNGLKYMKSVYNWLNTGDYEQWIPASKPKKGENNTDYGKTVQ